MHAEGAPTSPRCERSDLRARLVYWDDLPGAERGELEGHAASCPVCGPRLELLRRAQGLLDAHLGRPGYRSTGECPSSEELYDFGRGPGFRHLPPARLAAIHAHVVSCRECRPLVETLRARPPIQDLTDGGPAPAAFPGAGAPPPWTRWLVAAAAATLAGLFLWRALQPPTAGPGTLALAEPGYEFPAQEVLRGELSGPLLWPRGPLLGERDRLGLAFGLAFEIEPQEGASEYRAILFRQSEGEVFSQGEQFATLRSAGPRVDPPPTLAAELSPGVYTWEAWVVVNGLDRSLGRRDFEVVDLPRVLDTLEQLEVLTEPGRSNSIMVLLESHGLRTDLRSFARGLPESPERDAFLARPPGR